MARQVSVSRGRDLIHPLRGAEALRVAGRAALVAGVLAGAGIAQTALPDAQIESSVLKSLAGAPELASEQITTRTTNGMVTLSGVVSSEKARTRAEQLAANTIGVVKVVDELRLGTSPSASTQPAPGPARLSCFQTAPMDPHR